MRRKLTEREKQTIAALQCFAPDCKAQPVKALSLWGPAACKEHQKSIYWNILVCSDALTANRLDNFDTSYERLRADYRLKYWRTKLKTLLRKRMEDQNAT